MRVGVGVRVIVGVGVIVGVRVTVGVEDGVGVFVAVGVCVWVEVGVAVAVIVLVELGNGVGEDGGTALKPHADRPIARKAIAHLLRNLLLRKEITRGFMFGIIY